MLRIKYKIHGKVHSALVSYEHSANIIAGLLIAGATVDSVIGTHLTEFDYDMLIEDVNSLHRKVKDIS